MDEIIELIDKLNTKNRDIILVLEVEGKNKFRLVNYWRDYRRDCPLGTTRYIHLETDNLNNIRNLLKT